MENKPENKAEKTSSISAGKIVLEKIVVVLMRWLFMLLMLSAAAYSVFLWNKYIINAEWSEERKKTYIEEQSVFSFDKQSYQRTVDFMAAREKKFGNNEKESSKDIFYPEGF